MTISTRGTERASIGKVKLFVGYIEYLPFVQQIAKQTRLRFTKFMALVKRAKTYENNSILRQRGKSPLVSIQRRIKVSPKIQDNRRERNWRNCNLTQRRSNVIDRRSESLCYRTKRRRIAKRGFHERNCTCTGGNRFRVSSAQRGNVSSPYSKTIHRDLTRRRRYVDRR